MAFIQLDHMVLVQHLKLDLEHLKLDLEPRLLDPHDGPGSFQRLV
jgi:hypothetical protein